MDLPYSVVVALGAAAATSEAGVRGSIDRTTLSVTPRPTRVGLKGFGALAETTSSHIR